MKRKSTSTKSTGRKKSVASDVSGEQGLELSRESTDIERPRCDTDELIEFCWPKKQEQVAGKHRRHSRPRTSIDLYIEAANSDGPTAKERMKC